MVCSDPCIFRSSEFGVQVALVLAFPGVGEFGVWVAAFSGVRSLAFGCFVALNFAFGLEFGVGV